jgi:hypothetical protein
VAEQHEYLVAKQLEVDPFDRLKPVGIRFTQVADADGSVFDLLEENVSVDALVAMHVHISGFEL